MAETSLQRQVGVRAGGEHKELGRLLQEATRLLDEADLPGANETLKAAEQVLIVRRRIRDIGSR